MASYNERLRKEIARRDAALANLKHSGNATTTFLGDKLDETKTFITTKIHETGNVASREIKHARVAVSSQIEEWKTTLSPANIVRANPWKSTLGAVAAGVVAAPLLKSLYQPTARKIENSKASNRIGSNGNGRSSPGASAQRSRWKPVTDAILANLPVLIAAFSVRKIHESNSSNGVPAQGEAMNHDKRISSATSSANAEWVTTFGAAAAGVLIAPLVEVLFSKQSEDVHSNVVGNDYTSTTTPAPGNPVTTAILKNLPLLIASFFNRTKIN